MKGIVDLKIEIVRIRFAIIQCEVGGGDMRKDYSGFWCQRFEIASYNHLSEHFMLCYMLVLMLAGFKIDKVCGWEVWRGVQKGNVETFSGGSSVVSLQGTVGSFER